MTLLQLRYIVKIVECGSMNEASHELYISQPALSSSVKELENELGIEIFTRHSQGIALTVDGAEFLTYARQILDQTDLLEVLSKMLREKHLDFHPLFRADLHVFIARTNPLADRAMVTMKDLEPYPFLQYEQGEEGSFYFAEEAVWPDYSPKQITVSDRATMLNFIVGLNAYTVCTGIDNEDLNNEKIVSVPLESDESMLVGWIVNSRTKLSHAAELYLDKLRQVVSNHGYSLIEREPGD